MTLLLRCYPTIPHLINDWFGTDFNFPIYSFGFFLALAIFVAAWVLQREMKRKEKQGLLQPSFTEITKGEPVKLMELITNAIIGFLLGFKIVGAAMNYDLFVSNPQDYLISAQGSLAGGLIGAILLAVNKYYEKKKQQLPKPITEKVKVWPSDRVSDIAIIAAVTGVLGSKLFHNLEYWEDFMANPISGLISFSGLSIYGGLLVGGACVIWYLYKKNISVIHMADAIAPSLILSYGVGRIGCQLSGDGDWGIDNLMPKPEWLSFLPDWLWAYDYAYNVNGEGIPIAGCGGKFCFALENPVFPTPLYETIMATIIFAILWYFRKRIEIPGRIMALYLVLNGIERFWIEKIRVNIPYHIADYEITQAEIISVVFFLGGLFLWWWSGVYSKKKVAIG